MYDNIYKTQEPIFSKTFLYVGRYVKHKGIFELWNAFVELQKEFPNDWTMKCIGTGEEWENRVEHPNIEHLGFVQPEEMKSHLNLKSVYVLPSKFEPWGVTVQEFATVSCPLVLSNNVGAHELFLQDDVNGKLISEVTVERLKHALKSFIELSEKELLKMSEKSHELGMSYSPKEWTNRLLKIID